MGLTALSGGTADFRTPQGEHLVLDARKAVFVPSVRTLVIADVHAGKAGHFRSEGIPVPGQLLEHDLAVLETLLNDYRPEQVIFAGDLFHAGLNSEWDRFAAFLCRFDGIRFSLTRGNHDMLPDALLAGAGIAIQEEIALGSLRIRHIPDVVEEGTYVLAGHLHPGVLLAGNGRQRLTLPCFYFGPDAGILPAFGRFTGLKRMDTAENCRIFAVAGGTVVPV